MTVVEIIRKKRDGGVLSADELDHMIGGYVRNEIPDYQMSAFLMACFFRGMDDDEAQTFTDLMLTSGTVLDLSDIPGPKVDKHSTGGVADTVSLILAPIVASCGVKVPMISGRGLGHTGGTLDKLESIPGFRTNLTIPEFRKVLGDVGVSMIGQTDDIAPADRKLYALRDVTATIESPPLIAGSIMSKKLAAGIDSLVLDIKTGDGAFMQDRDQAVELGNRLVTIGEKAGKRAIAYVTDMDQPLGSSIGNWLEVEETLRALRGEEDDMNRDLLTVTHLLAGTMLMLAAVVPTVEEGVTRSRGAVQDGSALKTFMALVSAHGGDASKLSSRGPHPPAKHSLVVRADRDGYVERCATRALGMTAVKLGAGRLTLSDRPVPTAGIVLARRRGMPVKSGDPLLTAYADDAARLRAVSGELNRIYTVAQKPPEERPLILETISGSRGQTP